MNLSQFQGDDAVGAADTACPTRATAKQRFETLPRIGML